MNIVVDINNNENGTQNVVQGIKVFMQKAKNITVYAIGSEKDLATLKGMKNVELIYAKKGYEGKVDITNKEISLTKAFDLLSNKNKKIDALVSSADRSVLKKYSEKYLEKVEKEPVFLATYPDAYTGKQTLLLDFGYNYNATAETLVEQFEIAKRFATSVLQKKDPKYKVLSYTLDEDEQSQVIKNLDKKFKNDKAYEGIITSYNVLRSETDILIGQPELVSTVSNSINEAITVYDDYIDKARSLSWLYNINLRLCKRIFSDFHKSIDKKVSAGGVALIGFSKIVVQSNPTTTVAGVNGALEFAKKIARSYKSK